MTWLAHLYKTYENNAGLIGTFEKKRNGREYALIPVSHTTQTAHIEVHLDGSGHFLTAKVVEKDDTSTIIPCTEASASRAGIKPVPHPLFDKLTFVAGDFVRYCGEVNGSPYEDYLAQLLSWCESPYAHPKVQSVYTYLRKGRLIADLLEKKVLWLDGRGKLAEKWTPEMEEKHGAKPDLYKLMTTDPSAAFVRFAVFVPGDFEHRLWRDRTVQQAFISFYETKLTESDLCYVTGEQLPYADKHASRIRNSGDKSKLISANDTGGFTFRGRFRTSREAAAVAYDVSQKAHNALKWLIDRQSFQLDGKVFVVWGTDGKDVPDLLADTYSLYAGKAEEDDDSLGQEATDADDVGDLHANEDYELDLHEDEDDEISLYADEDNEAIGDRTHKAYAEQVRRALEGYRYDGDYKADVIIMVLDAATPGRMSIVYYQAINKKQFMDRLQNWHETCFWLQRIKKEDGKGYTLLPGAPATLDIAFAAYGPRAGDKLVKGLIERMLPCIVEGRKIPQDIVRNVMHRASNPVGMDEWEWEKTLGIACALINKTYEKEGFAVGVDTQQTDRSYLFGRLLAIADVLERKALGRDEKRATNAVRYMSIFAQRPERTWKIIQANLNPYQVKMGEKLRYYNRLLDEVGAKLDSRDFTDKPLSGLYLLGFYSQRHELNTYKKDKNAEADGEAPADENDDEGEM